VFDGHNDLLLRLWRAGPNAADRLWLEGDGKGHLDLPRMRRGGFAGGLFAIYVPSGDDFGDLDVLMDAPPFDVPLPRPIGFDDAAPVALGMAGMLLRMERAAGGGFRVCRSAADIRAARADGAVAGVMHMEGAEAIGPELDALHVFHALGLRSLGPVWSRPTAFGEGVPFRFPGDPDVGGGLTGAGRDLQRLCNELRILVDLSHLNAEGVRDVARLSDAPLVATHSCVHAICPSTRNLTDLQLAAIRDSGGLVGLNFATCFLRPDGRRAPDVGFDVMLRHFDHLVAQLGENHVGLGSDFDGATVPAPLGDVTGLPAFLDAMAAHGYDDALVRKIAFDNWLAMLERTWGG
jgi:membrane dipeptidase